MRGGGVKRDCGASAELKRGKSLYPMNISSLTHDDSPSLALNNSQDVHGDASTTQSPKKRKTLKRKRELKSSLKGVSHTSPKKRRIRIDAKFRLWLWRWRTCRLWMSNVRVRRKLLRCLNTKRHNCSSSTTKSRKCKLEVERHCLQHQRELSETSALVKENSLQDQTTTISEVKAESLTTTDISRSAASQSGLNKMGQSDGKDSSVQFCEHKSPALSSCNNAQTLQVRSVDRDIIRHVKNAQKELLLSTERHGEASHCPMPCKRVGPLERRTVTPLQGPGADTHTGGSRGTSVPCKKTNRKTGPSPTQSQTRISNEVLKKDIQEFLDGFYRMYGSFFALQREDTLRHLRSKFRMDFNERKSWVLSEAETYQAAVVRRPVPSFQVVYKKHMLTLEDLSSLENDNWLNDQVINMYGELIMESSHHKVHFFNSFFHRQLINKGYEGVRRWTKQVDLFSKQLLLIPVHLDVHWCLVAVNTVEKSLHLYDSQGIVFKIVAQDVMNYLRIEAKERLQTTFQKDWIVSVKEGIPQQTNENDCGVFVLEYCRCLASGKPLDFSQKHIPRVRRRIYKELCDCKIQEY